MSGGVLEVPKYTSRDVGEPVPAVQLRVGVRLTLVAPVAGLGEVAAPGGKITGAALISAAAIVQSSLEEDVVLNVYAPAVVAKR